MGHFNFDSWADSLSPERDERLARLGGHDITQVFDTSHLVCGFGCAKL
jgi:hypothetical protein